MYVLQCVQGRSEWWLLSAEEATTLFEGGAQQLYVDTFFRRDILDGVGVIPDSMPASPVLTLTISPVVKRGRAVCLAYWDVQQQQ